MKLQKQHIHAQLGQGTQTGEKKRHRKQFPLKIRKVKIMDESSLKRGINDCLGLISSLMLVDFDMYAYIKMHLAFKIFP